MNEVDMIRRFAAIHNTTPFSADAERFGDMLFTMDSFSCDEDLFHVTPPERIGHNMAAALLSDLLSCGIKGEFVLSSWTIDSKLPPEFYEECAKGIEKVLSHYGLHCIGGDMGSAPQWCWTAAAGGKDTMSPPVTRIASAKVPFDLYASGPFGDANLAAFYKKAMPEIELRPPVPRGTLFATDSSGGFLDALENFRRVAPDLTLYLEDIPIAAPPDLPFPKEYLLIGGAGEYELLYAVPAGMKTQGLFLGRGDFSGKGIHFPNGKVMTAPPPDYREITPDRYLEATERYYKEFFL